MPNPKDLNPAKSETVKPAIQKWADLIFNKLDKSITLPATTNALKTGQPGSPTTTLSLFGFKSPSDLVTFLRSPAGDKLLAAIGGKLDLQKAMNHYLQLHAQEQQSLLFRIAAALFLKYEEDAYHGHRQLQEIVQEQNKKAIKDSGKTQPPPAIADNQSATLANAIEEYEKALQLNQKVHEALDAERNVLNDELHQLSLDEDLMHFRYNLLETELSNLEPLILNLEEAQSETQRMEATEALENYMQLTRGRMDSYLFQIETLIAANQHDEASTLMFHHTALGQNVAFYHDLLKVSAQEKMYVNMEGNEVSSYREAHFILPKNPENHHERIYKDENNKYYLLKPGQQWNDIKDNIEAKNHAHKNFEHKKPELMVMKTLIQHNKGIELEFHKEQRNTVTIKLEQNTQAKLVATNQKYVIESSLAQSKQMLAMLQNTNVSNALANAPKPVSTPTPTATPKAPTVKPTSTQIYKQEIEKLKRIPDLTPQDFIALSERAPAAYRTQAKNFVNLEMKQLQNGIISPAAKMRLLQNLERLGVQTLDKKHMATPSKKHESTPVKDTSDHKTAPTPLNIKPY